MPTIKIRNLSVVFGKKRVLRNLRLTIHPEEYLVILGPTGAGKTTLLRTLAGLVKPEEGRIIIDDKDYTNIPPEDRGMAYLPQNYSLFPYLNVRDNVLFSPRVRRSKTKSQMAEIVSEALDMVNLIDRWDAYPNELSGGMMQRCALARAIATDMKIFLLDEPLRALDARLRIQLRTELRKLVKDLDITCLHVTHDQEEALAVADRIIILDEGSIIQQGKPKTIYKRPQKFYSADFLGEANNFHGTIVNIDESFLKVKVDSSNLILTCRKPIKSNNNDNNLKEGLKVKLSIKTENTVVNRFDEEHKKPGQLPNTINGKIIRHYFTGKFTTLEINTSELKRPLLSKISSFDLDKFEDGTSVTVTMDPKKLFSFVGGEA